MKTDRELLEFAAKAAGIRVDSCGEFYEDWNPLADDGDALRLAVKLQLFVNIDPSESQAADCHGVDACEVHSNSNPYTATRRAIVLAAAAIGAQHDQ